MNRVYKNTSMMQIESKMRGSLLLLFFEDISSVAAVKSTDFEQTRCSNIWIQ